MESKEKTQGGQRFFFEDTYRVILHNKLFHPALQDILPTHGIYDEFTPHYVSSVLVDFSQSDAFRNIKNRIVQESKKQGCSPGYVKILDELSHLYIEDMERTLLSSSENVFLLQGHKIIGDYALFMLGMFPGLFKEQGSGRSKGYFSKGFFAKKGSFHYAWADSYFEPWKLKSIKEMSENQFEILSEHFEQIVEAVDECNSMYWSRWADSLIIDPLLRNVFKLINPDSEE